MKEDKRLTISQVSELVGYKPHVIRFYEKEFNLIIPRNKSGHRYFSYKEVETLQYIKQLQEKGLTNNQIKLILKSPEIIVGEDGQSREIAVAKTALPLEDTSHQELQDSLLKFKEEIMGGFEGITENIRELTDEIRSKDKDILFCENAKLKLDVKRKAYEVAELKEQLKREKNRKKTLLGKLFYR
jgi:DNA-binding transcriptional MerR regulator